MAKLGECFSVIRNGASIRQTDGAGGFPITRIETIADKTINREKFGYAGIYDLAQYRDYILQDGDILMSHINSEKHLGKVALYSKRDDEQIIHGMNLLMLRADTQKVIPEYAKYYFESQKFLRQIGRITKKSVNQASFTVTALKELEIPLASIIVQRDISEKLKKVDWLVSLRKQQLAKLDELVKARFVEMFGTFPANPFRWSIGKIQDVVSDVRYGSSRPAVEGGKYPYLRMNNITYSGELDLRDTKRIDIPDSELDKCTVRRGDVLFNRTNSKELVGKTCVYNRDELMVLAGFVIRVRINERIRPEVLSAFLNMDFSKRMLIGMCKTAIGQANINAKELQNIDLYIPPIELQDQFVTLKNKIDQQKQTVQQSLEKLELMKKALMQEYFG